MSFISIWRTTVAPGEVTYIWARNGQLATEPGKKPLSWTEPYTLDDSIPLKQFNWSETYSWEDPAYATGLTVPADAPPGTYHLHMHGQETGVMITVAAPPPPRPVAVVKPTGGPDSANIQAALDTGRDVTLSPGVFLIDSPMRIPDGAAVRGSHRDVTILKRLPNPRDYQNRIFTATGDTSFSLTDFTVEGALAPGAIVFHSQKTHNNVVVQRLRLVEAMAMVMHAPGAFVQDVEFKRSGGGVGGDHQLWKDISWEGACRFNHECLAWGEQMALINASWRDTSRGMVLRVGPTNSFFSRLVFDGIQYSSNGDEVILVEDLPANTGLRNCLFSYVRIRNCDGAAIQFAETPVINNLFRSVQVNGGQGIMVFPGKAQQTHNVFQDMELRGCAGICLNGATGNTFKGLAIISPRPTWANQGYFEERFYPPVSSAITGADGNVFNPVIIRDLPEGWTAMS